MADEFDMIDLDCHEEEELDMIDLYCDEDINMIYPVEYGYETPSRVVFDIKRVETWSKSDSGVHRKGGPSPEFKNQCRFDCIKKGGLGDLVIPEFFNLRSENVQELHRPFDSVPYGEFLVSWVEKNKRGEAVPEPVQELNEINLMNTGLSYIKEAKNYVELSNRTLYLAMKYFKAYIGKNNWESLGMCNCSILLLSITCLGLAAKLDEDEFVKMAYAFGFSKSLVTKLELEVCKACEWRLWLTTPFEVLDILVCDKANIATERNVLYSKASQLVLDFAMTDNCLEVAFAGLLAVTHGKTITKEQVQDYVLSFKQFTNVNPLSCLSIIRKMGAKDVPQNPETP